MLQVALLGLVKAVDRYDPSRGCRFSSFAVPTIIGEVRRFKRDCSRMVRPSRAVSDLHAAVLAKEQELTAASGCVPTLSEIAAALGVDLEEVVEAVSVEGICVPCALDAAIPVGGLDETLPLEECVGVEDPELARAEMRIVWNQVLARLEPRLRRVIRLRYYQELSQQETARRLGISQMHVSRSERRALDQLRRYAGVIAEIENLSTGGDHAATGVPRPSEPMESGVASAGPA